MDIYSLKLNCPQSSLLIPQRVFRLFSTDTRVCLSLGNNESEFVCCAHKAPWHKSQFWEDKGRFFFSRFWDSIHQPGEYTSGDLEEYIERLVFIYCQNQFGSKLCKYLLPWVEGKNFFPYQFCLEEETFLGSLQPKGE